MKNKINISGKLLAGLLLFSSFLPAQLTSTVNYIKSDEIIFNPERGFSAYRSEPITNWFISSVKAEKVSVIQRIYTIPEFIAQPLSDAFLNVLRADLNMARDGGMKLILRFSYTDAQNGADAPLDVILNHISQIQPILTENYDVIAYVEAGFIGAWGEWYYSSNGLNNTDDRRTVLFALLDALPVERAVVVRTPEYKRKIFENDEPLTPEEAFNGSRRSRTGAHNDCFLSSVTDYGTYLENDIEGDKTFLNLDNRFVPQGGETCSPSSYSGCDNALTDLSRMHWSVLNKDYNTAIIGDWEYSGCLDEIKRRLGYRLELLNGTYTNSVKPGGIINIKITLFNGGFASPYNPRNLEFVLRNQATHKKYRFVSKVDPRRWMSGDTSIIELSAGILPEMEEGNYDLLLHLADPTETLHNRAEYAIRLANENIWEDSTGFNNLLHRVAINSEAGGENYVGEDYFLEENQNPTEETDIVIDGEFDDWDQVAQFDIAPDEEFEGDGINPNVDITDIWITDDADNVYISYSLAGDFVESYFYHVFFDLDKNPNTGFHMSNSDGGIDLMIENEILWEYTGANGEWQWSSLGSVNSSIGSSTANRTEMSISKNLLSQFGVSNSFDIVFNVNNLDNNQADDFAPDAYQERSYTYNYKITSIVETTAIPDHYYVTAYPNPFNGHVNISFNIRPSEIKSAVIYDILGRLVKSYSRDELAKNRLIWNAKNHDSDMIGSGIYFFVLRTNENVFSTKLVLIE